MVTRIGRNRPISLFLKEHREKKAVSPEAMAGRLGITRESLYRWEREQHRLNPEKIARFADALDMAPDRLWHHPDEPSADEQLRNATLEERQAAVEMVRIFVSHRR